MKTRIAIWLLALMTIGARADLTAVVTPGYQFPPDDSVSPTTQLLNLLGQPSVQIYGTVGGSNNISPGSITGISMSDSFPDGGILNLPLGSTLGWNVNSPRQLAVNTAGLVNDLGGIMANSSSNALYLDLDPGFFVLGTNSLNGTNSNTGYTNVFWLTFSHAGDLWLSNFVFAPWLIQTTNQSVNTWGTNAFEVTNLFIGTNLAPTLTATDTVPIVASAQGGPTAATLAAIGQYLASQNTLPPYTVGRVQFNGTNFYAVVSNAFTGGATLCISNYFISGIQAVVFATNGVNSAPARARPR